MALSVIRGMSAIGSLLEQQRTLAGTGVENVGSD
jgi:hypothetical protein